jgi:type II secretion system protein N
MKKFAVAFVILCLVLWGSWLILVPEQLTKELIEQSVSGDNLSLEADRFRKGLFLNIFVERLELKKSGKVLVSLDNAHASLNPLYLPLLKVVMSLDAESAGGDIHGRAEVVKGTNRINIILNNADIRDIPFFSVIGLSGGGLLSGELKLKDGSGEVRFSLDNVSLEGESFYGVPVPMSSFQRIRGIFDITPEVVNVRSVALEGNGLYSRLKGRILKGNQMDLTLEVMPNASMTESSFALMLIKSFMVSPGYYSIPIKGNLSL